MKHSAFFVAASVLLSFVSDCRGALLSTQEDVLDFGTVGQNAAGIINGGTACGPTSVYNSFVYLTNHFGITGLLQPGDPSVTINQLGAYMGNSADPTNPANGTPDGGVTSAQLVSGKTAYIGAQTLNYGITVESQTGGAGNVTIDFLYQQLAKGQDVEIKFNWTGSGAHFVTVTGINFDTTAHTGTLNILDPWGNGAGSASFITANLTGTDAGGYTISYSGGAAGNPADPDNPTDAGSGTIYSIAAESPVPEPSTLVLLGLGGFGMAIGACRRNRSVAV